MPKVSFNLSIIGAVFLGMALAYSLNIMSFRNASAEEREFKSDRTLIKEIIANQKQTHALLREIKSSLSKAK